VPSRNRSPRVGPLSTISDIRRELAHIYRAGRRGDIDTADMGRFAHVLRVLAEVIYIQDVEEKIDTLEKHRSGIGLRALSQIKDAA